jgi:hypothetical protein
MGVLDDILHNHQAILQNMSNSRLEIALTESLGSYLILAG